jgi:hypothetical protein
MCHIKALNNTVDKQRATVNAIEGNVPFKTQQNEYFLLSLEIIKIKKLKYFKKTFIAVEIRLANT